MPFSRPEVPSMKVSLCDFLSMPLLFSYLWAYKVEHFTLFNANSLSFISDSYIKKWMCWASKHEPFSLLRGKWQKYRLCDFFSARNYTFLVWTIALRECIIASDSNALSYVPDTNIEVHVLCICIWAIFAFNGEMVKKYKTLTFFSGITLHSLVQNPFDVWKYGFLRFQRTIDRVKLISRSAFLMHLNLRDFDFLARKWPKKCTTSQLWHKITNEQEKKWASQPHKVDKASQDLSIDIVFRSIWSLFILVKY